MKSCPGAKTALVGAGEEDINGNVKQGSFYIYKRPTETDPYWAQVGKKTAPDGAANDRYGVGDDWMPGRERPRACHAAYSCCRHGPAQPLD